MWITQDSQLEKVIQHGLNIIVSIIWENHVCVIGLRASYIEADGCFCGTTQDSLLENFLVILHG